MTSSWYRSLQIELSSVAEGDSKGVAQSMTVYASAR